MATDINCAATEKTITATDNWSNQSQLTKFDCCRVSQPIRSLVYFYTWAHSQIGLDILSTLSRQGHEAEAEWTIHRVEDHGRTYECGSHYKWLCNRHQVLIQATTWATRCSLQMRSWRLRSKPSWTCPRNKGSEDEWVHRGMNVHINNLLPTINGTWSFKITCNEQIHEHSTARTAHSVHNCIS